MKRVLRGYRQPYILIIRARMKISKTGLQVAFLLHVVCSLCADWVPQHGNNRRSGQNRHHVWNCIDTVLPYGNSGRLLRGLKIPR